MAIIKCKMCGGELNLTEGQSVAECEYCGSRQTVPNQDNEKKLQQFERADWLRRNCEFDKAAAVYEGILAEFRQESEAYWGLVLCKYGIEYVDDPATGKKIPTCHRSSYDSVLDDANLEQAMDYADTVARKVYREEAKAIEKIREGILEVSSNEKPYDIFICYKETAPDGDRTLDSVLAQDLYAALTDKGYRVFFSRITLQHKLGEAYEPYIFAALNSAKVMLAIGTDPEYYNAVWVKNEWSRYLKICAADKSKHLIPCYKDLDAYDMPKEFRPLQGVDLGKMGAIQDILFNMEKYIPLKKNTNVIQETVVVGGSGGNKIASLLDRGNMALEDGDWAKADSFFEDVLNNDSKNAQAYLGKTLATEKCRTIDAFARKRKNASESVRSQKLALEPDKAHVDAAVEKYSLPGFVEPGEIRNLYNYDPSYSSCLAERKRQYQDEERYWENHKLLSRAEKFAVGAVAENLQKEKKALFAALSDRVKQAENAENAAKKEAHANYAAFLKQADEIARTLCDEGMARRESRYQDLLESAKTSADVKLLNETAAKLDALGDYQDSKNLAGHCRKRAEEEQAKLDAEKERQQRIKEKQEKARKAKNQRVAIFAAIAALIVIAAIVIMNTVVIPSQNYNKAMDLLENGQYSDANASFEALGDYKDSAAKAREARSALQAEEQARLEQQKAETYSQALTFVEAENYEQALDLLNSLGNYQDSAALAEQCRKEIDYAQAMKYLDSGKDQDAYEVLVALGNFRDAEEYLSKFDMNLVSRKWSWTDGSGNEETYTYGVWNRLTIVHYGGHENTTIAYQSNGVPSVVKRANGSTRVYDEEGFLASYGEWKFTPAYGADGKLIGLTGVCSSNRNYDEPGEEWKLELAEGDVLEIPEVVLGPVDLGGNARQDVKISVLRAGGKIREEYIFPDPVYKTSYVCYYVHELDEHGNAVKSVYTLVSVTGDEFVYEINFQLTYNQSNQLVERRYTDEEGRYTARQIGINGYNGNHVITYTYSEDGKTVVAEWICNGRLLRKDTFTYEPVYNP